MDNQRERILEMSGKKANIRKSQAIRNNTQWHQHSWSFASFFRFLFFSVQRSACCERTVAFALLAFLWRCHCELNRTYEKSKRLFPFYWYEIARALKHKSQMRNSSSWILIISPTALNIIHFEFIHTHTDTTN